MEYAPDTRGLTKSDELYRQEMGEEAFERETEASRRRCNCGEDASIKKFYLHKPGCRAHGKARGWS